MQVIDTKCVLFKHTTWKGHPFLVFFVFKGPCMGDSYKPFYSTVIMCILVYMYYFSLLRLRKDSPDPNLFAYLLK